MYREEKEREVELTRKNEYVIVIKYWEKRVW